MFYMSTMRNFQLVLFLVLLTASGYRVLTLSEQFSVCINPQFDLRETSKTTPHHCHATWLYHCKQILCCVWFQLWRKVNELLNVRIKLISYECHLCYFLWSRRTENRGDGKLPPLVALVLKSAVDDTGISHITTVYSHHIQKTWRQSGSENIHDWSKLVFPSLLALLESLPLSSTLGLFCGFQKNQLLSERFNCLCNH